ncbi:hypothetical protein [Porticoccus sp.]
MSNWLLPWSGLFRSPLSGDVNQDYAPVTSWFSPQLKVNFAGDQDVESRVVADVASYGKQLGILTDALLELADGEQGEALAKLKALAAEVEQVKQRQSAKLEEQVRADLKRLQQQDPAAFEAVMKGYR